MLNRTIISSKPAPFPKARFLAFLSRLKIQTKDFGMVAMQPLGTQTYVLDEMCAAIEAGVTTFLILKARQLGMTTFFIALDLFWAMDHPGLLGSFVTHTDQAKANFRNMIKIFFAHLPKSHRIRWDQENRDMIVLKNGSLLQYLVAGTKEKVKGGLGRSSANNYIHATEVAFWGSPDDLNELSATYSTHYPHRLKIEETTANGFNFWEERWREGKDDPTVCCIFVGWWRHDHYAFLPDANGDEHPYLRIYMPNGAASPLSRLERHRVREVKKRYDFAITPEQIAWYRWKLLSEELQGDQVKMDEMYPWVEEDAFVATGTQFFSNAHITAALKVARQTRLLPFEYVLGDHWRDSQCLPSKNVKRAQLKVWEEADPDGYYVLGCDPAYGSGPDADRTVITVCRCYADKLVQVAEFVSPTISTYQCAWVLCHLAGYYRNVLVNLEITGPGEAVYNEINLIKRDTAQMVDLTPDGQVDYDLRYVLTMMRQFLYGRVDSLNRALTAFHWKSTGSNKFGIFAAAKDAFDLGELVVYSMPLLEEMKTIVVDGGQVGAEKGKKDDRVVALTLAHVAYKRMEQSRLQAMGLTYRSEMQRMAGAVPNQAMRMGINYLRAQGIMPNAG